jgi:hypothetical protein
LENKKAGPASGFGNSAIFFPKKTRRFPSPPHERVGFIGVKFLIFGFYFFGGPLKHLSQRGYLNRLMDLTFRRKILICMV